MKAYTVEYFQATWKIGSGHQQQFLRSYYATRSSLIELDRTDIVREKKKKRKIKRKAGQVYGINILWRNKGTKNCTLALYFAFLFYTIIFQICSCSTLMASLDDYFTHWPKKLDRKNENIRDLGIFPSSCAIQKRALIDFFFFFDSMILISSHICNIKNNSKLVF